MQSTPVISVKKKNTSKPRKMNALTGIDAAARTEESETYLKQSKVIKKTQRAQSATRQSSTKSTAKDVETPLPPQNL